MENEPGYSIFWLCAGQTTVKVNVVVKFPQADRIDVNGEIKIDVVVEI